MLSPLFVHFREECASGRVVILKCTGKSFRNAERDGSKSSLTYPCLLPSNSVPGGISVDPTLGEGSSVSPASPVRWGRQPRVTSQQQTRHGACPVSLEWLQWPNFLPCPLDGKVCTACAVPRPPPQAGDPIPGSREGSRCRDWVWRSEAGARQHLRWGRWGCRRFPMLLGCCHPWGILARGAASIGLFPVTGSCRCTVPTLLSSRI